MTEATNSVPVGENISLTYNGKTIELPVLHGTEGNPAIDLSTLTKQTGLTALDYGFVNTASTKSKITYIDGEQGILRYRGYPIDQVATNLNFLQTAYLLIHGEVPTQTEYENFEENIRMHTLLHEGLRMPLAAGFAFAPVPFAQVRCSV